MLVCYVFAQQISRQGTAIVDPNTFRSGSWILAPFGSKSSNGSGPRVMLSIWIKKKIVLKEQNEFFFNYKKKWQGKIFLSVESLNTEFFLHLLPLILIFLPVWIQLESGSTTLSTCTLYKCTEYCSGDCSIGLLPTWGCLKSCWWWCPRRVWTAGALFYPEEKYLNKNKKTTI